MDRMIEDYIATDKVGNGEVKRKKRSEFTDSVTFSFFRDFKKV